MLNREDTGLIVVDIQGKLARLVADSDALIARCQKLIKGAQALGMPIVWLEQNPEKLGTTVPEISDLLSGSEPIAKYTFNGCEEPAFMEAVAKSGCKSWLVCGIEAHICVYQTSAQLQHQGFDMHLVTDCVSSRNSDNRDLAIIKLSSLGVAMTGLEMCLYELVKDCREPEFKTLLDLVR